jgi:hypothetical protein
MKKRLDFRLEEYELDILENYCASVGRTKSDVRARTRQKPEDKEKADPLGRGFKPKFSVTLLS